MLIPWSMSLLKALRYHETDSNLCKRSTVTAMTVASFWTRFLSPNCKQQRMFESFKEASYWKTSYAHLKGSADPRNRMINRSCSSSSLTGTK